MLKRFTPTYLSLALLAFSPLAQANTQLSEKKASTAVKTADNSAKEKKILNRLQKEYPTLKVKSVHYFPDVELYEIFTDTVFTPTFMDEEGLFMFNNGEVIDVKNKKNLTKREDIFTRDEKNLDREKKFLEKLKKEHPAFKFVDALYLPSVKLYELSHENPKVLVKTYANENLSYVFNNGALLDLKNKVNLSDVNVNKRVAPVVRDESFTSLPLDTAIKMTYGKSGVRAIAVFSDPRCPWCKKMDTDIMQNLKGVDLDVYYFMNPLNIRGHEDAPDIAKRVLCAPDKVKAWKEWMLLGQKPENDGEACAATLQKHLDIAISREFNSTPVILTDTGFILPSTLSSTKFANFLTDTKYINQPHLIK